MDQPPPNIPRVVQDGTLEGRNGQSVPVLVQSSSQRLLVLNSVALSQLRPGQRVTLHLDQGQSVAITLAEIDQLALIARYLGPDEDA